MHSISNGLIFFGTDWMIYIKKLNISLKGTWYSVKQEILELYLKDCIFSNHNFFVDITFNDHDEEIAKPADQKFKASFLLLFRIKIMNVIAISIIIMITGTSN